ncbi:MAG: hypothetical protein ACOYVK_11965 [Bacillota bacterium]
MVKIIAGGKGTGKTKAMIDMANQLATNGKGHVVFIDDDNRHIYDLKHAVRFICTKEYPIKSAESFLGFLCGIISEDHDIEAIYIDGITKIVDVDCSDLPNLVKELKAFAEQFQIDFIVSVNCEVEKLPEELKEYAVA